MVSTWYNCVKSTLKKITVEKWLILVIGVAKWKLCWIVVETTLRACLVSFCLISLKLLSNALIWKKKPDLLFTMISNKSNQYSSFFAETSNSHIGVVAGSVVGALVLVILILVFFVHRRYTYTFTFKIGNLYYFYHNLCCPWTILLGELALFMFFHP